MTFSLIFKQRCLTLQKSLLESVSTLQSLQFLKLSSCAEVNESELLNSCQRKILKVAIVGRPNAGKSTLVNCILNLNVCGVSHKTHTTKSHIKAAFTQGDTQIVFVDTPGFVTNREYSRFNLSKNFISWKKSVLNEADIIGVVHEVTEPKDVYTFHLNLVQHINDFPESKKVFLVLNKLDLVIDKAGLSAAVAEVLSPQNLNKPGQIKLPKIWKKFSRVFYTSALKSKGVADIVNYLLEEAKPGNWIFEADQVFDKPLDLVVIDLLRAQLLDVLPGEIPYQCVFEIEYMKENDLGEIICVALVTCKCVRHAHLITRRKNSILRIISRNLESDLYKILNKVFKIRIVVISGQRS